MTAECYVAERTPILSLKKSQLVRWFGGKKCFLHQFSHLTCLLADLVWLFFRCKVNPKVRSMAHKAFAVLGTPSPAVSRKPPLFTTSTLVAQW